MPRFLQLAERVGIRAFAIDEAHCISHWGHDFRPEYRRLTEIKSRFPRASVHAYTATATERVRADIAAQLRLTNPALLVGTFDRPNLVYRVVPRVDARTQALEVLRRHAGQAAIVYCISRNDTESMAAFLQANRLRAAFYHAGMEADERRRTQDDFASEAIGRGSRRRRLGMGIDRRRRALRHPCRHAEVYRALSAGNRPRRPRWLGAERSSVLCLRCSSLAITDRKKRQRSGPCGPRSSRRRGTCSSHMPRLCSGVHCRHRKLSEYFGQ